MEFAVHRPQVVDGDPRINLGGLQRGVPEHFLELPDRCAITQHVGGAAVAETVCRDLFLDAGALGVLVHDVGDSLRVHAGPPAIEEEMFLAGRIGPLRADADKIALHEVADRLPDRDDSVLAALALAHEDVTAGGVDVVDAQTCDLLAA